LGRIIGRQGIWYLAMPHYFFDLEQGLFCILDIAGCHADDDAAMMEALTDVLSELDDSPDSEWSKKGNWTMAISDQTGRLVTKVRI
jgi:hypothetical protein